MIFVTGTLDIGACGFDAASTILRDHVASVTMRPGCVHCSISIDCVHPHRLYLNERWETPDDFLSNGKNPAQRAFSEAIDHLGIRITDLRAWAADEWIDLLRPAPADGRR